MRTVLFRANNIFASRVLKYINYYERVNADYTIVGWDRKGDCTPRKNFKFFNYPAGVNVGGIRAIINHTRWMCFVFKTLKQTVDVSFIHACDLNSAYPAALYKKFINKDVKLVFDSCDWFSANFSKSKFLKFLFEKMEKFACDIADELIICEPERIQQITFPLKKKPLILPNIPEIDNIEYDNESCQYQFNNNWPIIAYFGGFSDDRFQKELLTLTKSERFNLLIAGYGSKSIEELCDEVAQQDNVRYFGKVDMRTGLQMCKAADVIYAMYCKTNSNHIYAAPNKFYEALYLGKPIITTKGIILAPKVINNDIGYVIEEDINELRDLIKKLDYEDIVRKGNNASALWNTAYSTYIKIFFQTEYSRIHK